METAAMYGTIASMHRLGWALGPVCYDSLDWVGIYLQLYDTITVLAQVRYGL